MQRPTAAFLLCFSAFGCAFAEIDYSEKTGPCAPGWIGETGELCRLPADGGIDGSPDVQRDVVPDADGGLVDGVRPDAPSLDVTTDGSDASDTFDAADAEPDVPIVVIPCEDTMLLCDDFDGDTSELWELVPGIDGNITAEFDTRRSRSGSHALRVEVVNPVLENAGPHFRHDFEAPFLDTTVYIRYYIYLESGTFFHINHVGLTALSEPFGFFDLKVRTDNLSAFRGVRPSSYVNGSEPIPRNTWQCVSARLDIGDLGGFSVATSYETITATGVDTQVDTGLQRIYVGALWSEPRQEEAVYWLDDIAFDDAPLPCGS